MSDEIMDEVRRVRRELEEETDGTLEGLRRKVLELQDACRERLVFRAPQPALPGRTPLHQPTPSAPAPSR